MFVIFSRMIVSLKTQANIVSRAN